MVRADSRRHSGPGDVRLSLERVSIGGLGRGIQSIRLAEATAAGRRAAEKAVYANQLRGVDLLLFEVYLRA
jgi:hypothetical protein